MQYYHWWGGGQWDGGVNVSVAYSSEPTTNDLTLVVEGVQAANWSNYVLVIVPVPLILLPFGIFRLCMFFSV